MRADEPSPARRGPDEQQRQILRLTAEGRTWPEIARIVGVSERTARRRFSEFRRKVGAKTYVEAVVIAVRSGEI